MAEKVHAGVIYHYHTTPQGNRLVRHLTRVVRVHDKLSWRPPRNPVPLPDWAKEAQWTLWEGDIIVDGQRLPVVGVSPNNDPPPWFAFSVDNWRSRELALQPWVEDGWDDKIIRRSKVVKVSPTCGNCRHWIRNEGFPGRYGKCDRPFVPTKYIFPLALEGAETHDSFGCTGFEPVEEGKPDVQDA